MSLWHDIGSSLGIIGAAFTAVVQFRAKKVEHEAKTAIAKAQAEVEIKRSDDDTARLKLHNDRDCLRLVRELGAEVGLVREDHARTREHVAALSTKLTHCEDRHDEKDGEIIALRSRIERMERKTQPPEAAE